jgi:hypothetical protein
MAVKVEFDRNGEMSKPFLRDLRLDTVWHQMGCMPDKGRRDLSKGSGIRKVAKALKVGTGTVHRIAREMAAEA